MLSLSGFFTSIVSGSIGMAGGIMMLSIMANYFTPIEVIPLHGLVQLFSNSSRVVLGFKAIQRGIVAAFFAGAVLGAAGASQVVLEIPEREFKIGIAIFILVVTWLPKIKAAPEIPGKFFWIGLGATFVSVFVGATGLLIGPFFLREPLKKAEIIASQAACQTLLHFLNVLVFVYLGFAFGNFLPILTGVIAGVFLGNWVGQVVMEKIPENVFRWFFRATCTLLALRMLYLAI